MRSQAEIETYIRDLLCEALDHRLALAAQKLPHQCQHNYRHMLDTKREVEGQPNSDYNTITSPHAQTIGLCVYGSEEPTSWNGTVCEDPQDAKGCPYYKPVQTPEEAKTEFLDNIADTRWLAEHLPNVFSLFWVLGEYTVRYGITLSWWSRAWRWLRGNKEATLLLPPGPLMGKWVNDDPDCKKG